MSSKKNIDQNIQNRISDLLKKLTKEKNGNNREIVELLLDIQKNNSQLSNNLKLHELFDCMQNAVAIYEAVDNGKNFKFVDFNPAAEKIENIKKEKVIGKKVTEVFPGIVEIGLLDVFEKVWKTGVSQNHPVFFYEDARIEGWRENYIYKLITGEIVALYQDVTKQKQAVEALRINEENYEGIFNTSSDAIYIQDKNGVFIDVNIGVEKMYGYKRNSFIGKTPEFIGASGKNDINAIMKAIDKAYNGKAQEFEYWGLRKNGEVFLKDIRLYPGKYNGEKVVIAVAQDVSKRRETEDAIRNSEEKFKNLLHFAPDAFFHGDEVGNFIACNEAASKLTGYSREELLRMNMDNLFSEETINTKPLRYDLLKVGRVVKTERELAKKNGDIIVIEMNSKIMSDGTFQSFTRDITERINGERALKESERNFRLLFENSPLGTYVADYKGNIIDGNKALLQIFGSPSIEEAKKINVLTFPPLVENGYTKLFKKCIENNETFSLEIVFASKWGKEKTYSCYLIPLSNNKGEVERVYTIMEDISKRKEVEKALRESEAIFRNLSDSTASAIFVYQDEKLVFVNSSFEELTGFSRDELLGMKFLDVVHPDYRELIRERGFVQQDRKDIENRDQFKLLRKDGSEVWIDFAVGEINWNGKEATIGSAFNITDQKNAELAIQGSENKYRLITSLTSDYLFSTFISENGKSISTWVGGSFEKITGYTFEEYNKNGGWSAALHPDDLAKDMEALTKLKNNKNIKIEVKTFHKSGKIVWVKTFGSPVWDKEKNRLIGINGACTDITKEKEALLAVQKSEEKYRLISNITSDYLYESRFNEKKILNIIWVAGSFEKMTGYKLKEYQEIGGWLVLLHKDDVEINIASMEELMQNRKTILEVRTYHKDGRIIWIRNTCSPIWDKEKNKLLGVIGAAKDITQEKQNQIIHEIQYNIANAIVSESNTKELFAKVREELNKILNTTNFYIAFYDEKNDVFTSDIDNDEKDDIEIWSAKKSISGCVIKRKKQFSVYKEEIIELINSGEITLVGTIPEVWVGVPLKVRDKVIAVMAVQSYDNRDAYNKISVDLFEVIGNQLSLYLERNRAKEDASRLSRAIVQSPVSVIITNLDGEIEYVNPKFEKISGYTFEEVIGENPSILKSGIMSKEFYENLWKTILTGKDWHGEFYNRKKDGKYYWENVVISPIENNSGQITHFVAIKEDITEKKKMIEELISSKEKAEVSEKIKTEFLAQMSHEIRSPLNVILSFVGLLKEDLAEIATNDMILSFESIDSASTRITRTIDLILNMTDLQLGSYKSSIEEISVVEVLKGIQREYNQYAIRKGLELRLNIQFNRKKINSDKYALIQIISNLVDNAIKYSDNGFVEIFADKNESRDLVIKIIDTGIGISKEFLPNIFNSFSQEEQGYTRSYDGNGLGMALVKKYCGIISAEISVKSKKGKGTTFTLVIPSLKK